MRIDNEHFERVAVPAVIAAALCCVALLAAGCSAGSGASQPGGAPVASLAGHGSGAGNAGPLTTAQGDADFVHFTRCMRAHGISMQDPVHIPGHSGLSLMLPTQSPQEAHAYSLCQHFIAAVIAMKNAGLASRNAANLPALTAYARCMRSHDIAMLDPTSFGALDLGNVPGITSDFGRYSPQFRAADSGCRHLLPAGVSDNGTGP